MNVFLILGSTPLILGVIGYISFYVYMRLHIVTQVSNELSEDRNIHLPSVNVTDVYGWISITTVLTLLICSVVVGVNEDSIRSHSIKKAKQEMQKEAGMLPDDVLKEQIIEILTQSNG